MDLAVTSLSPSGQLWHSISGTVALYIGQGLLLAPIERIKTEKQTRLTNHLRRESGKADSVFHGHHLTFAQSFVRFAVRAVVSSTVDYGVLQSVLPDPLVGACGAGVSAVLVHPLSTLRTAQIMSQRWMTLSDAKPNADELLSPTPVRRVPKPGSPPPAHNSADQKTLWAGLAMGCLHDLGAQVLGRVIATALQEHLLPDDLYGTPLGIRLTQFVGLSVGLMAFLPLETIKKHQQLQGFRNCRFVEPTEQVVRGLHSNGGVAQLWRGYLWAIPEAACVVLVTHFVSRALQQQGQ